MRPIDYLICTGIFASTLAQASPVIPVVQLYPATSAEFGFEIIVRDYAGVTKVDLIGPEVDRNGCTPARTGLALLDSDGDELVVQISPIENDTGARSSSAYFTDDSMTMIIWIDYSCEEPNQSKSARYKISSDFLNQEENSD